MDLSIIIPAYRSKEILSQQLPVLLEWTSGWNFKTEIIVVIDGDDVDAYKIILKQFPVIIAGYQKNEGKGFAIKHGFRLASAPTIIYTDADIPFSPEDMLNMAATLQAHAQKKIWVIGDRTLPASKYFEQIPRLRKAGSDFFLLIIKHTLGKDFTDTQCGLKGFTKEAGKIVFSRSRINRFAFDFECLFIARQAKITVLKMPVSLRNQSPSTIRIYRDGWRLLKDVLKVILWYKYE